MSNSSTLPKLVGGLSAEFSRGISEVGNDHIIQLESDNMISLMCLNPGFKKAERGWSSIHLHGRNQNTFLNKLILILKDEEKILLEKNTSLTKCCQW